MKRYTLIISLLAALPAWGATLLVKDPAGNPLPLAMVTSTPELSTKPDLSDDGYAPDGVTNTTPTVVTRFTNASGIVNLDDPQMPTSYRVRAQGYVDSYFTEIPQEITLQAMNKEQLVASYPSNVWLSQLTFGGDVDLKKRFELNCAFCHQQASPFMRNERSEEEWLTVIERMGTYGARLPEADHQRVAQLLREEYRTLRENPETIPAPRPWDSYLSGVEITEWPIGDGFSQMHDFLLHPNGFVYIGDNLFDRLYEVDPDTGEYTVYKVPHAPDMTLGGIMGHRFKVFPKMYNYMGVHSLADSKKDGNIFITPSMQQALLEFNVTTKEFTTHLMPGGYYPHTIRVDAKDRVWFTLALSSQVAMYDRQKDTFTLYDLPARSVLEWLTFKSLPVMFWIDPKYRPLPSPDNVSTGLPMPYGIDIAPDGTVWVARLYANDLAKIDPPSGEVTMIDFPYNGPRRLRIDADGVLWLVAFQDSLLVSYDPQTGVFKDYPLPVINEIPYALNVDKERRIVWVNGNQSDTLLAFDIATSTWKVYPMPRQRFFSRDIEIEEDDGAIFTTNSHFPTWQSEGGVPTLLRIRPLPAVTEQLP
ncbi:MAG: lyase [Halioglobus sp.]